MKSFAPICLALCLAGPALSQVSTDVAEVSILPGWMGQDGRQMAGIRIDLAPGWKTYWRAPGDAGIPPLVDFARSENVAATQMAWPVPEVFDQNGMRSIGYEGHVVVPLAVTPTSQGDAVRLSGTLHIGVCEEICIPISLDFDALLPPDGGRDPAIVAAMINRPQTATEAQVSSTTCRFTTLDDGITLTATLTMPSAGGSEIVVVETGDPYIWVSEADTTRSGNQLTATVDMIHSSYESFGIDRSLLRFTVLGQTHAVDIKGCDPA